MTWLGCAGTNIAPSSCDSTAGWSSCNSQEVQLECERFAAEQEEWKQNREERATLRKAKLPQEERLMTDEEKEARWREIMGVPYVEVPMFRSPRKEWRANETIRERSSPAIRILSGAYGLGYTAICRSPRRPGVSRYANSQWMPMTSSASLIASACGRTGTSPDT